MQKAVSRNFVSLHSLCLKIFTKSETAKSAKKKRKERKVTEFGKMAFAFLILHYIKQFFRHLD
jgi:hypothetical protein